MIISVLNTWNKYDKMLFLLIASLAFGGYGGALQVPRILTILFLPSFIQNSNLSSLPIRGLKGFCIFLILYIFCSFGWTPDKTEGLKALVYYPIHLFLFLEILVFSTKAASPFKSISFAWMIGFACLGLVAVWEILTDSHLSITRFESGTLMNNGSGEIRLKTFASGPFLNYNDFNVYICYCIPFIIYILRTIKSKIVYILTFGLLMLAIYVVSINASRGAIISIAIMTFICLWDTFNANSNYKIFSFLVIIAGVFVIVKNYEVIFGNIMYRMYATEMLDGSTRYDVWERSILILFNTGLMGCGVGGLVQALANTNGGGEILITHNLFLEILCQFGVLIFIPFLIGLWRLYKTSRLHSNPMVKRIILGATLAMPFYFIVNSTYLLNCSLYAFLGSLFVFAYNFENQ